MVRILDELSSMINQNYLIQWILTIDWPFAVPFLVLSYDMAYTQCGCTISIANRRYADSFRALDFWEEALNSVDGQNFSAKRMLLPCPAF
jgi:hypothetical protein